ncbi:hypothetical protein JTE90_005027 [Oedothorax gibbosus]|uniref:Elongation of very long chain fatty acids protein n=1 Tax=Oedothorax gibbosus TaxID=931172 RepID=A0AAV6VAV2_9ARAC|nr:hypothetical protein JTE90_005027 [Oedothorax gibbosus]
MTLIEYMKETLDAGDPTIRQWPLVDSYYTPFLCTLMYVFFVKRLGPTLMENRKPFDLRALMIVYNFSIVVTYTSCLLLLIYYFLTTDAYERICSPTVVTMDDYTYPATYAGWIIYVLKYVEYCDTIFFVLRKKDHLVTNLHVIHHAALPIIAWIMLRTETSGFQFIPGGINSFIHIIMYTYYGLAAMGPEVQKYLWWKEHLTKLQMLQFVVILFFVLVLIPLSGCKTSTHGIYIDIGFAALFLVLFYNFYMKTYKNKKPATGKNGKEQNGTNGKAHAVENKVGNGTPLKKQWSWSNFNEDYPVHGPITKRH